MRQICVSFVLLASIVAGSGSFQAEGAAAGAQTGIRACSLLTRELAMKFSSAAQKLVFDIPPDDSPVGNAGSNCEYGGITLLIDGLTPAGLDGMRKTSDKEWLPVTGVGDRAYFRNNKKVFAELIGVVGSHTFFIQMAVPFQGTAEGIQPNLVGLANAITPKLR